MSNFKFFRLDISISLNSNCTVYSFGINNEWSFEGSNAQTGPRDCVRRQFIWNFDFRTNNCTCKKLALLKKYLYNHTQSYSSLSDPYKNTCSCDYNFSNSGIPCWYSDNDRKYSGVQTIFIFVKTSEFCFNIRTGNSWKLGW